MICTSTLILFWLHFVIGTAIEKPVPTFEAFRPIGIRVTMPHVDGLTEFFLWGNINVPLEGQDLGSIQLKTYEQTDGQWVIEDMSVKLNPGDTIYYTFFVNINNEVHRYERQQYTVEALVQRVERVQLSTYEDTCLNDVIALKFIEDGMAIIRKGQDGEEKETIVSTRPVAITIEKGRIEFGKSGSKKC
ncbi:hypothetical protein PPYR_07578 [Photinus pyralis]|uniref:CBM39 domain-containing protein n=2 Tax=Photinus pyralis TaxID=7054 RepID=A0A1Y1NJ41_PHOPY|nr:hypothetical protein PPYR_07578 [Photinus pyralis]